MATMTKGKFRKSPVQMQDVLAAGERSVYTLVEGQNVNLKLSPGGVGTAYLLDAEKGGLSYVGNPQGLKVGDNFFGPYRGTQKVLAALTSGTIDIVVGDSSLPRPSARPKSDVLRHCISAFFDAPIPVVTNPYSLMVQAVLEAPWLTMRAWVANADTNAVPGMKVSFGATSTLGAPNGTLGLTSSGQPIDGAAFRQATWNGNSTGTLTASAVASTGTEGANLGGSNCSWTPTDWTNNVSPASLSSSGLPIALVNITWPAGVNRTRALMNGTTSSGWDSESTSLNRPYRAMAAPTKDSVANSAWMLTSNGGCARTYTDFPPIILEYVLANGQGETLFCFGNSIEAGSGADTQYCGWPNEFQAMVSTVREPVSICNLAVAGSSMQSWVDRAKSAKDIIQNASVHVPSLTPNNLGTPQTASEIVVAKKYFADIRVLLDKVGLMFFTSTCLPSNSSVSPGRAGPKNYGTSDMLYRVPYNTGIRSSGFRVSDFDGLEAWTVDSSGQYCMPPAWTLDGIHPATYGYKKMATVHLALWRTL